MSDLPRDAAPPPPVTPFNGALLLTTAGLVLLLLLFTMPQWDFSVRWRQGLGCVGATLFGLLVGATELVARYRDNPWAALRTRGAWLYMALNAVVSAGAYLLIISGRITAPPGPFGAHPVLNAVFFGGFGGVALLRASVANVRVRDRTVSVGPAFVLQVLLDATDRACDRERGETRVARVREIMKGVVYQRAEQQLPFFAYTILQNLTAEERNSFDQALRLIKESNMSSEAKCFSLGLVMMDVLGEDLLASAVENLNDRIRGPEPDEKGAPIFAHAALINAGDLPAILATCRALMSRTGTRETTGGAEPDWVSLITGNRPLLDSFPDGEALISEDARVVIVLAALRSFFGTETVSQSIGALMASAARPADAEPEPPPEAPPEPPPGPEPAPDAATPRPITPGPGDGPTG